MTTGCMRLVYVIYLARIRLVLHLALSLQVRQLALVCLHFGARKGHR